MDSITPIVGLIIGVLLLFFGYKLQKWIVILGWFLLGYMLGGYIGGMFTSGTIFLIIQIGCGLLLAGGGWKLEKIALCVAIAYYTYCVLVPYNFSFFSEALYNTATIIGISIIVGIIAVRFIKPILILVTAFYGATMIVQYLPNFVSLSGNILTYGFYVLIIIGAIVQGKTN